MKALIGFSIHQGPWYYVVTALSGLCLFRELHSMSSKPRAPAQGPYAQAFEPHSDNWAVGEWKCHLANKLSHILAIHLANKNFIIFFYIFSLLFSFIPFPLFPSLLSPLISFVIFTPFFLPDSFYLSNGFAQIGDCLCCSICSDTPSPISGIFVNPSHSTTMTSRVRHGMME